MAKRRKRTPRKGSQLSMIPETKKVFGGSLLKGNAKEKRPVSTKHPMHIVLRSLKAKGNKSFLNYRNRKKVDGIVFKQAKRFGIEIWHYENVGNHLHLTVRVRHRQSFLSFLKAISGLIARFIMGCEKGSPMNDTFWDARPFTRIVDWGKRSIQTLKQYMHKNRLQALGFSFRGNTQIEFSTA
jgi:REP element-mobilizing transposase RayT